jgi:hypothetical protein
MSLTHAHESEGVVHHPESQQRLPATASNKGWQHAATLPQQSGQMHHNGTAEYVAHTRCLSDKTLC